MNEKAVRFASFKLRKLDFLQLKTKKDENEEFICSIDVGSFYDDFYQCLGWK